MKIMPLPISFVHNHFYYYNTLFGIKIEGISIGGRFVDREHVLKATLAHIHQPACLDYILELHQPVMKVIVNHALAMLRTFGYLVTL